jgi:hypothetical protein
MSEQELIKGEYRLLCFKGPNGQLYAQEDWLDWLQCDILQLVQRQVAQYIVSLYVTLPHAS